ncbi:hypothetical protein J7M07_03870, partial [bacterium]|nr:hypothetical protein [bacterium]
MSKQTKFNSFREMPIRPMTVSNMLWNKTGSWRNVKPVYVDNSNNVSPCIWGCPANVNIEPNTRRYIIKAHEVSSHT